jgi:hypothetical protein
LEEKFLFGRILFPAFFVVSLVGQATAPERKVQGNVIVSERDPKVRIELPKLAQYVGADRWVLYGIADCELHAFVEANSKRKVERLYWIQFEGYVASRPDLHHRYDSTRHTNIGGLDFYLATWIAAKGEKTTPGSDLEHIQSLIRAQDYKMPAGMAVVRLVHLMDDKRKELMFIYAETLEPSRLKAAELDKAGKAHDRWPAIEKRLVKRAASAIRIEQL